MVVLTMATSGHTPFNKPMAYVLKSCRWAGTKEMWLTQSRRQFDLIHIPHNALVPYPKMCIFLLQNGALWDICFMHCSICEITHYCARGKYPGHVNTLRLRQNGWHFTDDIPKCIFLNENLGISTQISLKFVPKGPIDIMPALVQIMAWHHLDASHYISQWGHSSPMHICITQPQWVSIPYCSTVMNWT